VLQVSKFVSSSPQSAAHINAKQLDITHLSAAILITFQLHSQLT